MTRLLKSFLIMLLAVAVGTSPALADDYEWRGFWRTTTGESGYDFDYCEGGTKMCAVLVWLNDEQMHGALRGSLNQYAVMGAQRVAPNTWQGPLFFRGLHTNTTLTFKTPKSMTIAGCYLVWCKSFDLVKTSRPTEKAASSAAR